VDTWECGSCGVVGCGVWNGVGGVCVVRNVLEGVILGAPDDGRIRPKYVELSLLQ
jgi:hypothetical protein